MIINWLLFMATFLIGYYIGKGESITDKVSGVAKKAKRIIKKPELGGVQRITPEAQAKQGTQLEETEEAMNETLSKFMKPDDLQRV